MSNSAGNSSKRAGVIAMSLYVAMWVLLLLLVTFNIHDNDRTIDEGILVNFGNSETGMGSEDLMDNDNLAQNVTAPVPDAVDEEFVTQEKEDAPVVPAKKPAPKPQVKPQPQPTPVVEKPREVNKKALFPGRSSSSAQSEGVAGGEGNQGNPAGAPQGSHSGTGLGTSGSSYNLNGRSLMGSLPKPDYAAKEEGRVMVEIKVNQQGEVIATSFRSVGSTTTNSVLVAAAERAAKRAKFNVDENAPFPQVGTIIYNFKMN